jgi:RNA polymerase sigma-70 factor (ECF subfamily)
VSSASGLPSIFVEHLPEGVAPQEREALDEELGRFVAAARIAWPGLALDARTFVQHLAERSTDGRCPAVAYAGDAYLACACAHRIEGALAAFEEGYSQVIARAIARKDPSPSFVDEVQQKLRERLFVAAHGLPKIAEYGGRAALRTWLIIAASRAALMVIRGSARRRESPEIGPEIADAREPELVLLKRRYAGDFAAALAQAFTKLSDKERTLLELHLVDGLSIDKLGEVYKVGRSTAARWLASARHTLVEGTRTSLRAKLGLSESEYGSLATLVRSQLDVSVLTLLRRRP